VSVKSQVGKGTMFTINLGANCRPRREEFVELTNLKSNDSDESRMCYRFLAKRQKNFVFTYKFKV